MEGRHFNLKSYGFRAILSRAKLPLHDTPTDSANGRGTQNCCTQKDEAVADHPGGAVWRGYCY